MVNKIEILKMQINTTSICMARSEKLLIGVSTRE